jgi:hypothetical protein
LNVTYVQRVDSEYVQGNINEGDEIITDYTFPAAVILN